MKHPVKLIILFFFAALLMQCSTDDEVVPVDTPEPAEVIPGDPTQSFSTNGEKNNVTASGFDVSGGLFLETDSGAVSIVTDAAFSVSQDVNGYVASMEGTGQFQMPDLGMFTKLAFEKALEVAFVYNTGKFFKDGNDKFNALPLRDTSYYFFFTILNVAQNETLSMENAELGVTSYFLNMPQQELIIPTGTFAINTPEGKISVGDNLAIGLSVKKSFPFTPREYPDSALNAVIDQQQAFKNMTGFLYLSGEISLGEQVPLKLNGNAVIDGDIDELFTRGFGASTAFSLAVNGNLVFGHDLLDLIPLDFDVELTSTTLKYDQTSGSSGGTTSLKFAGEFDDNVWMETVLDAIAGRNISQYVPFTGNEGNMFFSVGNDWEFYVNTYFAINTPHLGKQNAREGTLHVNSNQLAVIGSLAIPFMPGEVRASGTFGYDGAIHLQAKADGDLEMESVKLKSNLDIDINNDRATLKGDVFLPYGLGKFDVDGLIDSEGLTFSGSAGNKPIQFGNISMPVGALEVDANIRTTNPYLKIKGSMELWQMEQPLVSVSGSIDSRGLEVRGTLNTAIKVSNSIPRLPLLNVSLVARSWQGVSIFGETEVPYGIAKASFQGELTGKKDASGIPELSFHLLYNGNPTIKIKNFSLPTTDLQLEGSTLEGIHFTARVTIDRFGTLGASGIISGNSIQMDANFNSKFTVGILSFDSGLNFNIGSNLGAQVAIIDGWVQTPFSKIDVDGNLGYNGHFGLTGYMSGCAPLPVPGKAVSAAYVNTFTIASNSGFAISTTAKTCVSSCDDLKNCAEVSASLELDWEKKTMKLCVPSPFGSYCVGI